MFAVGLMQSSDTDLKQHGVSILSISLTRDICPFVASNFLKVKLPELVRSHIEAGMCLLCFLRLQLQFSVVLNFSDSS